MEAGNWNDNTTIIFFILRHEESKKKSSLSYKVQSIDWKKSMEKIKNSR